MSAPARRVRSSVDLHAANDPFPADRCYPSEIADDHPYRTLEVPESGDHVGFVSFTKPGTYWSERRAASFLATACHPLAHSPKNR